MRRSIAILIATSVLAIHGHALAEGFQSPCDDPLFQELKKKPLEQMTEREFQYFMQKDRQCSGAEARLVSARPGDGWRASMGPRHRGHKTFLWGAVAVVAAGAATTGIVLLADQHRGHGGGGFQPVGAH